MPCENILSQTVSASCEPASHCGCTRMNERDYITPATSRLIRRKMTVGDSSSRNRVPRSTDKQRAEERTTEFMKAAARSLANHSESRSGTTRTWLRGQQLQVDLAGGALPHRRTPSHCSCSCCPVSQVAGLALHTQRVDQPRHRIAACPTQCPNEEQQQSAPQKTC